MSGQLHERLRAAAMAAVARPMGDELVREHLIAGEPDSSRGEKAFARAFDVGLGSLSRNERHGMNAVTGHVAESVAATLLVDGGWHLVQQFTRTASGGHGIDLAVLTPDTSTLYVVEVKGSLRQRGWPRLSRGEVDQFTREWLNKPDNPGMGELGVHGEEVSGLVILLSFGRREWKAMATQGFADAVGLDSTMELSEPEDWF